MIFSTRRSAGVPANSIARKVSTIASLTARSVNRPETNDVCCCAFAASSTIEQSEQELNTRDFISGHGSTNTGALEIRTLCSLPYTATARATSAKSEGVINTVIICWTKVKTSWPKRLNVLNDRIFWTKPAWSEPTAIRTSSLRRIHS